MKKLTKITIAIALLLCALEIAAIAKGCDYPENPVCDGCKHSKSDCCDHVQGKISPCEWAIICKKYDATPNGDKVKWDAAKLGS